MKTGIHPTYYTDAKVICTTCGTVLVTGSTEKEVRVEVCSNCHPFYTGKQNLVDTAGRVDRFKRLVERRDTARATRTKRTAKAAKSEA
ncbi:MAG: 50S ribosomal protein L31 [Candidatus Kerfeldbacteria bacterium]|nr:50S ribosomal protein L31 [Candidatus Kerfeldbacteria bacterium]